MKKIVLCMLSLAAFSATAALAQDINGDWQGTLKAGRDLRIIIKITSPDESGRKAVCYSIDQGAQGFPASSVTLQGSAVKIAVAGLGGTYEGKLSADWKSISGTWTQGPTPLPLDLVRATPETAWAIPEPPPPPVPMAADAKPSFEVATIKPSSPDAPGKGIRVNGRNFSTLNTTLTDLITFAYGVHPKQITNAPAWIESEKFDIAAKPDGAGQPSDRQWKMMIQKLLTERFELTFHRDRKELSVYTIILAKTGSKLTKSAGDPDGLPGLGFRGLGHLVVRNATILDFAGLLQSNVLDRPVLDQTTLPGRYDFTLDWTPDEFQFNGAGARVPPAGDAAAPPDLFTAMQAQLGLKMDSTKAPADVLVVDTVAKPSDN